MTDIQQSSGFTPISDPTEKPLRRGRKVLRIIFASSLFLLLIILVALSLFVRYLNQPPESFPLHKPVVIEQGKGVRDITRFLAEHEVIRSDSLLYYTLVLFHDPTNIKASAYVFETPLTTAEIARRLTEGDFDADLIRFTHYEGESVHLIAKRAAATLPNFNYERFMQQALPQEGKLFPETYFIPASLDDQELLDLLRTTFDEQLSERLPLIEKSPLSLDETLVLASIIEREANSPESMAIVSGILQNRLTLGMPLQADASIEYILDKPLAELTPEDLEIDSPYNTYLYTGLPPTPIGNPGLIAIDAVIHPTPSEYLFYVTDENGTFYYATTYEEHLVNIERYLR